jgi:ClpP class serine protease
MAKSAATMICLGSNAIYMSKTSELGPIDPQVTIKEGEELKRLSVVLSLSMKQEIVGLKLKKSI